MKAHEQGLPVQSPSERCSASAVVPETLSLEQKQQRLVVMRHGKRHDSDQPRWNHTAAHPWDTPLSKRGVKEIETLGPKLEALQPELVVVSPFLRCMQTAHRLLSSWSRRPANLRIVVDKQLAEVYHPTLLYQTDRPSWMRIIQRYIWQWTWKRRALELLSELGHPLELLDRSWPAYPENKYRGHERFKHAIDYWASRCSGNILLISHGDAVLSAIKRVQPFLEVLNVQPGGYMVMARQVKPSVGPFALDDKLLPWHGVEFCMPDDASGAPCQQPS